MGDHSDSIFAPWGTYQECETAAFCRENTTGFISGLLAECIDFSQYKEGVPAGRYCACGIYYWRIGSDCENIKLEGYLWIAAMIILGLVQVALALYILLVMFRAYRLELLKINAVFSAVLCSEISLMIYAYWSFDRALVPLFPVLHSEAQTYLPGIAGSACTITMLVVTLIWDNVIRSSKKLERLDFTKYQNQNICIVTSVCVTLTVTLTVVTSLGFRSAATATGIVALLGIFLLYRYKAWQLQKMVDSSDSSANRQLKAIRNMVRQMSIYLLLFLLGGFVKAGVTQAPVTPVIAIIDPFAALWIQVTLTMMTSVLVYYAIAPLIRRISEGSSTAKESVASMYTESQTQVNTMATSPQSLL